MRKFEERHSQAHWRHSVTCSCHFDVCTGLVGAGSELGCCLPLQLCREHLGSPQMCLSPGCCWQGWESSVNIYPSQFVAFRVDKAPQPLGQDEQERDGKGKIRPQSGVEDGPAC